MTARGFRVAGLRRDGSVKGYVDLEELGEGVCGDSARTFDAVSVLGDNAPIIEAIRVLQDQPMAFVRILGEIGGIVTRTDLQDPPVRMWLFGLLTAIEMRFQTLIQQRFTDESWMQYVFSRPGREGEAAPRGTPAQESNPDLDRLSAILRQAADHRPG